MAFKARSEVELRAILETCECGAKGVLENELLEKLCKLEDAVGERLAFGRGFVCKSCTMVNDGYGDSGHPHGTDVDVSVYGQYFRHSILKYVAWIFPVITVGPRTFHLSVRKDWPQGVVQIY